MHRRISSWPWGLMALTSLLLASCAGAQSQTQTESPSAGPATGSEPAPVAVVVPSEPEAEEPALATARVEAPPDGAPTPIPEDDSVFAISAEDPAQGRPDALVTLVVFGDIQCPFTGRLFGTMQNLRRQYNEGDLRIVWKHLPLPFHKEAAPAAEASVAVHRLGGSRAFYCFLGELLNNQRSLDASAYQRAAQKCGVNPAAMEAEVRSGNPARKVSADLTVAAATGSRGTPNSFVNGIQLSGSQSIEKFTAVIDAEKAEASKAISSGVSPFEVHAHRAKENFSKPTTAPVAPSAAGMPNTTVYKVPLGQSPALGSAHALVTIVMFMDFQCPFCRRAIATIEQLRKEYGNDLRVVFKHNPLPFHNQAMPAAQLAMEARVQKGNMGFWLAYDALFAETTLDDAALDRVAQSLRLNATAVRSAIASNRHRALIDADIQLAKQLGATGTPSFYINGRRLTGAQPIEKFRELINEVLPAARALTQRGVPRASVYTETIKTGVTPPNP